MLARIRDANSLTIREMDRLLRSLNGQPEEVPEEPREVEIEANSSDDNDDDDDTCEIFSTLIRKVRKRTH